MLTITTPIMTQTVITAEQVQCCIQVRVNLVNSVTDSFQSHPPVWSFWLMFAGRHIWETSTRVQTQQENTNEAVVVHSPLHVIRGWYRRLVARWFNLCSRTPQNVVLVASQVSLLVFISLKTDTVKGGKVRSHLLPAVEIASGLDAVM